MGKESIEIEIIDDCLEFSPWFKKIKDLEKWLDLKIMECPEDISCRKIVINYIIGK